MTVDAHPRRRQQYLQFSTYLAQLDSVWLATQLTSNERSAGWGSSQTLELAGTKFFIKRIPVTDTEYEHLFSTANLYDLPMHYHYGIGSAGFGVFRELLGHIKTTNWVLNGEIESFPLLYHYRLMPRSEKQVELDQTEHQQYLAYWGGNENIGRYLFDRAHASHELVLFLELIPYVLHSWLLEHLDQIQLVLNDLCATLDFLGKHGILHFDPHFWNVLTDGERFYLTDFGLMLDADFALQEEEQAFFQAHTHYDYGRLFVSLFLLLYALYKSLPEDEQRQLRAHYGMSEGGEKAYEVIDLFVVLGKHVEDIHARGMLRLNATFLTCMVKYHSILTLMSGFFSELSHSNYKDTKFPNAELGRRLREAGLLVDLIP